MNRPDGSAALNKALLACLIVLALGACAKLPSLDDRSVSRAYTQVETADTRLGRAFGPKAEANPGLSGVHPLAESRDAFAARVQLARAADRSLDVQYYIWHEDMTGTLLFESLLAAADRGVRVRFLLDDNNTSGLDDTLAALDAHPNIEVRLFNPFVIRKPRAIGFLTDFSRLNRRMHNKSFTADNQATIIGGRNVGDEYFGASEGVLFADLDVLAVGPVVRDVSKDFDRYWASRSSYPVDRIVSRPEPEPAEQLGSAVSLLERDPAAAAYVRAIRESAFVEDMLSGKLAFEWAPVRMVSDDPAKGLGKAAPESNLTDKLRNIIGEPTTDVELVSPYFVPTAAGVDAFAELAGRGVKIRILTNSLEATDVAVVHAGYAKRRKPLLEAGITLYEMRSMPEDRAEGKGPRDSDPEDKGGGPFGSSGSSLHAKTFSVDRSSVFIGSFNFDPRSANLNTELGFVIESPALASRIEDMFDEDAPFNSYEVQLTEDGQLYWLERRMGGEAVRHDHEPGTSFWQRVWVVFLSLLPIEGLL